MDSSASPRPNRARRLPAAWVASTYLAEGLPYSLVHQISAQLFLDLGSSLEAVGLTALYGLAWNLKFAWSPWIARVGTLRSWVLGCEAALALAAALLVAPTATGSLDVVARLLVVVAIAAATHDLAVDGLYLAGLSQAEQTRYTGLRVAAYRVALLVGNGAVVALAGRTSWVTALAAFAALLGLVCAAHALWLPRPSEEAVERPAAPAVRTVFRSYLAKPGAALAVTFIVWFRAGDALLFAMGAALYRDLGLDTTARGMLGGASTVASIAGSVAGSWWLGRRGLRRGLVPIAVVQSAAIPLYAWLAWARPTTPWIAACVLTEQLIAGVGTSALMVFLMRQAAGEHKVAHFAVGTALMSWATTALGSGSGFLASELGFVRYFWFAFVVSVPGVLAAWAMVARPDDSAPFALRDSPAR